jgi:signal transduction histidine kinase
MSDSGDARSRFLRTEFLERIAHELRGPAGVTLGALDELEHAVGAEASEQNRVLFAMARRGAKRVLRTAERLTRTAQLEGGNPHVTRMPADLRTLVRQSTQDAELVEGRSSVKVALRLPEEACAADVDGAWLGMALSELVSQAIRCARREVEVTLQARAGVLRVVVSDDRYAAIPMPTERFVPLEDRRDAALNWPLVHDVARAHAADLSQETLRDDAGAVTGFRVALQLQASATQLTAASNA